MAPPRLNDREELILNSVGLEIKRGIEGLRKELQLRDEQGISSLRSQLLKELGNRTINQVYPAEVNPTPVEVQNHNEINVDPTPVYNNIDLQVLAEAISSLRKTLVVGLDRLADVIESALSVQGGKKEPRSITIRHSDGTKSTIEE